MKKIELTIECPDCKGTGVYSGMGEGDGIAVVCYKCKGTGAYKYSYLYNDFTGRKEKEGIKRVYLKGYGYTLGLGKINFSNGIGEIDMDKEGVSYSEFLAGKLPTHRLNGGWCSYLPECKNKHNKDQCWERFITSQSTLTSNSADKTGSVTGK